MSSFQLSPGITPELTDIVAIVVPLAIGLGYLLAGRRGFETAFSASGIALGAIKLVTDYSDLPDLLVAIGAIVGGGLWIGFANGVPVPSIGWRTLIGGIGAGALLLGVIKLRDFYDPFDLLLADTMIVAGVAVVLRARDAGRAASSSSLPDSAKPP